MIMKGVYENVSLKDKRGVVTVMLIIYLPVLLLIMALVIDVGLLSIARSNIQAAADFGALAGAQNLDLDKLQFGDVYLEGNRAREDSRLWAEENIHRNIPGLKLLGELDIDINIYNASLNDPLRDCFTGRLLIDPTVCVVVRVPYQFHFIHGIFGTQEISVHADASVVVKR